VSGEECSQFGDCRGGPRSTAAASGFLSHSWVHDEGAEDYQLRPTDLDQLTADPVWRSDLVARCKDQRHVRFDRRRPAPGCDSRGQTGHGEDLECRACGAAEGADSRLVVRERDVVLEGCEGVGWGGPAEFARFPGRLPFAVEAAGRSSRCR
jgi:hypothetical protein